MTDPGHVLATAEARRLHLAALYRQEAERLSKAATVLQRTNARTLAARPHPVPHVGGPRLRRFEDALDDALMAL